MLVLRPVFRALTRSPTLRTVVPRYVNNTTNLRMASSTASAPLQEWLVIIPDQVGALQKRIAARPKHLEGLKADREDLWLWGGMLFPPFLQLL